MADRPLDSRETDNRLTFKYTASRANGTTQSGWFCWPPFQSGQGMAKHVVTLLMRARFNRAVVTLDGIEVGWITQERPGAPRSATWDESV